MQWNNTSNGSSCCLCCCYCFWMTRICKTKTVNGSLHLLENAETIWNLQPISMVWWWWWRKQRESKRKKMKQSKQYYTRATNNQNRNNNNNKGEDENRLCRMSWLKCKGKKGRRRESKMREREKPVFVIKCLWMCTCRKQCVNVYVVILLLFFFCLLFFFVKSFGGIFNI